ncbi:MAG: osmotically inducible protein C [Blastocatellia bacterium]|nr:MAG: osmotically inducible protein C [Blastocatellia bacterium]
MQEVAISTKVNGLEVERLFETIGAIKKVPGLADFKFRLENRWINAGLNRSTIKNFYGTQQEHEHEPFVLDANEPEILLGEGTSPSPVEYLLHALVSCVTSAIVYHAAAKGIQLQEVESKVEGDIDLHGFLGLDENIRKGYKNIRMKFRIKADVPDEQLEELLRLGPTFSPVFDSVTRGVPVEVSLEK